MLQKYVLDSVFSWIEVKSVQRPRIWKFR